MGTGRSIYGFMAEFGRFSASLQNFESVDKEDCIDDDGESDEAESDDDDWQILPGPAKKPKVRSYTVCKTSSAP